MYIKLTEYTLYSNRCVRRSYNDSIAEYRSKRSAAGANVVDEEATTAKRGERDLYRLLRTLKKRSSPGDYRLLRTLKRRSGPGKWMRWLVHKREVMV